MIIIIECKELDKTALKITADGSHTIYVPQLNETYHSTHGAIQEAQHVFIAAGLHYFNRPQLHILELGLGTGLNAFLTLLEAQQKNLALRYTALEKYPLSPELLQELNYTAQLNSTAEEALLFQHIHQVEWEQYQNIIPGFALKKNQADVKNCVLTEKYDLIYFDAFGPEVQPQLWTKEIFEQLYHALEEGGILVTYCAKGAVKRALKEVGFEVENLPGPPGKREITRATKC